MDNRYGLPLHLRARELKLAERTRSSIPGQLFPGMCRCTYALDDKSLNDRKYVRYVDLSLRFQDTILGHLYGVSNGVMYAKHRLMSRVAYERGPCASVLSWYNPILRCKQFSFLEADDLQIISDEATKARQDAFKHDDLYDALLDEFAMLPESHEDVNLEDYAIINVSPAVVPSPYVPSFRIYSYNVSGDEVQGARVMKRRNHRRRRGQYGDKETECSKEEWSGSWKCHLNDTWSSNPQSPSRINQRWTPLGYAQVCGTSQGLDRCLMRSVSGMCPIWKRRTRRMSRSLSWSM